MQSTFHKPEHQLLRCRIDAMVSHRRMAAMTLVGARCVVAGLSTFLIAIVIDVAFHREDVRLLACLVVAISGGVLWRGIAMMRLRVPSRLSSALALEKFDPAIGHSISSAIEFLDRPVPENSRFFVRASLDRASSAISTCSVPRAPQLFLGALWSTAAVILFLSILFGSLFRPESFGVATVRLLQPWRNQPWPVRHQMVFDSADNAVFAVRSGGTLTLTVRDTFGRLPKPVSLLIQGEKGEIRFHFSLDAQRAHVRFHQVFAPFRFSLFARDAAPMPWQQVTVAEPPCLEGFEVDALPPPWSPLIARVPCTESGYEVPSHTRLGIHFKSSSPLSRGFLVEADGTSHALDLSSDGHFASLPKNRGPLLLHTTSFSLDLTESSGIRWPMLEPLTVAVALQQPPRISIRCPTAFSSVDCAPIPTITGEQDHFRPTVFCAVGQMPIEVDATADGAMRSLTLRLTLLRPNEESQLSHSTTEITSESSGTSQSASQMQVVKQFVFPVAQSPVGTFVQTLSLDELIRFHALGSCAGDQVILEASAHTWTGASTTLQRVFQLETLEETSLRITSNCEELSKEVIHSAIELQRVATSFSNAHKAPESVASQEAADNVSPVPASDAMRLMIDEIQKLSCTANQLLGVADEASRSRYLASQGLVLAELSHACTHAGTLLQDIAADAARVTDVVKDRSQQSIDFPDLAIIARTMAGDVSAAHRHIDQAVRFSNAAAVIAETRRFQLDAATAFDRESLRVQDNASAVQASLASFSKRQIDQAFLLTVAARRLQQLVAFSSPSVDETISLGIVVDAAQRAIFELHHGVSDTLSASSLSATSSTAWLLEAQSRLNMPARTQSTHTLTRDLFDVSPSNDSSISQAQSMSPANDSLSQNASNSSDRTREQGQAVTAAGADNLNSQTRRPPSSEDSSFSVTNSSNTVESPDSPFESVGQSSWPLEARSPLSTASSPLDRQRIENVWKRLRPGEVLPASVYDVDAFPAEYRNAINAYYRLLTPVSKTTKDLIENLPLGDRP